MSVPGPPTSSTGHSNGTQPTSPSETENTIPWAFVDCSTDTLIVLISHMLNLLIQHNDQVVLTPDALTRFHSRAAPGISVVEYLRRIVKYTNMEKIPLLSLLAYIDITCQHLPTFTLSSLTVHRFLIAGVCAGSKAQCDVFCTNAHYAKVGGIKVQELNALEREFLKVTQWNLCCNADLLQRYYTSLIRSHGGFTQATQPSVIPFKAFPRSLSKPPPDEEDADMEEDDEVEGNGSAEDDVDDIEEEGVDGEGVKETDGSPESSKRANVDMVVDPETNIGSPSSSSSRGRRRPGSSSSRSRRRNDMDMDEDEEEPISPSTSSIPTSSRSSIRTGSRGRGRAVSLSYTDARPASPLLNRTPVSASPFKAPREVSSKSPLDQQIQSDLPTSTDEAQPHDHDHDHNHHGHSHHLLKSLVGGIFHRKKSHSQLDRPTVPPPADPSPASSNVSHRVIPSRPIGQDLSASLLQAQPRTAVHSTAPIPSAARPQASVSATSRNSSITRSPRTMKSPGMAKPVTPRIRTHEEFGELGAVLESSQQEAGSVEADDGKRRARVE